VGDWRENGDGRDHIDIPFEQLAQQVLERAPLHLRGERHANAITRQLRRRAHAAAFNRAAKFIESRL
jgi:hypothetical protein